MKMNRNTLNPAWTHSFYPRPPSYTKLWLDHCDCIGTKLEEIGRIDTSVKLHNQMFLDQNKKVIWLVNSINFSMLQPNLFTRYNLSTVAVQKMTEKKSMAEHIHHQLHHFIPLRQQPSPCGWWPSKDTFPMVIGTETPLRSKCTGRK